MPANWNFTVCSLRGTGSGLGALALAGWVAAGLVVGAGAAWGVREPPGA
jgi:hypothetical protein